MNEQKPEWYAKLKGDPIREKTFTLDKIHQIEQKAEEYQIQVQPRKRKALVPLLIVTALAAMVLFVVIVNKDTVGQWFSDNNQTGIETPIPTSPPPSTPTPTETSKDLRVEITETAGVLWHLLPFKTEDVSSMTVLNENTGKEVSIPEERNYIILQSLNWIDLTKAKAVNVSGESYELSALLRLHLKDGTVYAVPYDINNNVFDLGEPDSGNSFYYSDDQTVLLMQSLLNPDSQLAELDRDMDKAHNEDSSRDGKRTYNLDQLMVNGNDYAGWEKELESSSLDQPEIRYYDSGEEKVKGLNIYDKGGIIAISRQYVFTTNQYKTSGGVTVGSTPDEVLANLGEPSSKSASKWNYNLGDYQRFYLLFEENVVKYMVVLIPL
ncbi:hypothetical protein [Cohnella abietis]|uniref:Uncharacterized protein n=1 Tax=Cohnella abietis TaxID=2507935 RepID=A0A3T1CZB3_9BACL|nr:hypothetical protein [Cohnella abietis]BBI31192.1 hypothetical protein KCTCHS21_05910 [Cohnella abietis]